MASTEQMPCFCQRWLAPFTVMRVVYFKARGKRIYPFRHTTVFGKRNKQLIYRSVMSQGFLSRAAEEEAINYIGGVIFALDFIA